MKNLPEQDRLISERESDKKISSMFDAWEEELQQEKSRDTHRKGSNHRQRSSRFEHA